MRIRLRNCGGVCDADLVKQLDCACMRLRRGKAPVVDQAFADLFAYTQRWVQEREWVLKDEAHASSAEAAACCRRHRENIGTLNQDPSTSRFCFRRQKAHRCQRNRAL